jgi:hypothetical protein
MNNAERYIKYVVGYALQVCLPPQLVTLSVSLSVSLSLSDLLSRQSCREDLDFFTQRYDPTLLARLQKLIEEPFARISYADAVTLLQREIEKSPSEWKYPQVSFGVGEWVASLSVTLPRSLV